MSTRNSSLRTNEYPAIQDLKNELTALENRLNELTDEKVEYERLINAFNSEYMVILGGLIEEILKRRATIFGSKLGKEQQEAQLDYAAFQQNYQQQLRDLPQTLDESEKQQLKTAYRKASRLCHPDKLSQDAKAKGEEFFKALNEAYRHQNIERVQGILLELESEASSLVETFEHIDNKAFLQEKIVLLREQIDTLKAEITRLQEDETYRRIQEITDMDGYFTKLERELKAELKILKGKKRIRN
ncbi:J domain-containing protein [Methylomonas methanica]|uniref:Heat shock protein DnaJ domain protein n=1 Tax=Methylomonas methanica (strain DSM 25384 / MC09) TaxID=857087 RepID=G0A598_METMM|nr:J domain-containing protein [Methylomonas methanica]AEG00428.1 heat shock protein DnaJ domain protein [Methylomonas methanica MC09]